jgi:hypothetical protein
MSAGTPPILTEDVREFPQSLEANARILRQFGHIRFLPNLFQLRIRLSLFGAVLSKVLTASLNKQQSS